MVMRRSSRQREDKPADALHSALRECTDARRLADDTKKTFGLSVCARVRRIPTSLPHDLCAFVFDAAQEMLFNVVKHAGVREARLRAGVLSDNRLQVEVCDDGAGFDPSAVSSRSLGLFGIRERAGYFGGDLLTESAPGHGTRGILTVPLTAADRVALPRRRPR
jgi:signal transduction histidine kinase